MLRPPLSITEGDVHMLNELLHSPVARRLNHSSQPPLPEAPFAATRPNLPVTSDLVFMPPLPLLAPHRQPISGSTSTSEEWTAEQGYVVQPEARSTHDYSFTQNRRSHHAGFARVNSTRSPERPKPAPLAPLVNSSLIYPQAIQGSSAIHSPIQLEEDQSVKCKPLGQLQSILRTTFTSHYPNPMAFDGHSLPRTRQDGASAHCVAVASPILKLLDIQQSHFDHSYLNFRQTPTLRPLPRQDGTPNSSQDDQGDVTRKPPRTCKVAQCMKSIQRHGLCHKHGGVRRCINQGCMRKDRGEGYCVTHGGGKRCAVEGCGKVVRRGTFCLQHTDVPGSTSIEIKEAAQMA